MTMHFTTAFAPAQERAPKANWLHRILTALQEGQAQRARREIVRIAPFLPDTVAIHGDLVRVPLASADQLPFNR